MEWLTVIAMLCSGKVDADVQRIDCEKHFTECVEWVSEQPETSVKALSKLDIATWITKDAKARKKVCPFNAQ